LSAASEWVLTEREVVRLLGASPRRLRQLARLGLVKAEGSSYSFRELVALRVALSLLNQGATVRRIRHALESLRRLLPESETPLSELRLVVDGRRILLERGATRFDPRTGQALLSLDVGAFAEEARASALRGLVRPLAPPSKAVEAWFHRASLLENDPARWEEAMAAYEQVVTIDPTSAAAWNNLGLLHHRMGHYDKAGECYRAALAADPASCEARYNLGSLHEDTGDPRAALGWYRLALEVNPDYADAHFNLAGLLARTGQAQDAARHWRRYLELDPESRWAELARTHLEEMEAGGVEQRE
jgi:tetratricopeptide (TPR) repeat protein